MIRALVLVALCACTVDRDVLVANQTITTCPEALAGASGQACAFTGTCDGNPGSPSSCCSDTAYCEGGALVVNHACNPDCAPCTDDRQCTLGAAICTNDVCEPCPSTASCTACPAGWTRLARNGCPTCDCAPPSDCNGATTANACLAVSSGICYVGADCTSGCAPGDEGCCSNQCAAQGCTGPIPVGCMASCASSGVTCATTCVADHCDCVAGQWKCTAACVDGAHASCIAP
ncbi:MAG TPA: hypothetical protein VLX92_19180 [Kofleriaceae bacterium]|nr:hypothetical protein [Kofleriaceae bacterium]